MNARAGPIPPGKTQREWNEVASRPINTSVKTSGTRVAPWLYSILKRMGGMRLDCLSIVYDALMDLSGDGDGIKRSTARPS